MSINVEKLEGIVWRLNQRMFEHLTESGADPEFCSILRFSGNGHGQEVTFMDISVWDSESDERDDTDEPGSPDGKEDLEPYLIRRVDKLLTDLSGIAASLTPKEPPVPVKEKWMRAAGLAKPPTA